MNEKQHLNSFATNYSPQLYYYLGLLAAMPNIFPGNTPQQIALLNLLEQAQPKLHDIFDWLFNEIDEQDDSTGMLNQALQFANSLYPFWRIRGYWQEGLETTTKLIELVRPDHKQLDQYLYARVLNSATIFGYLLGNTNPDNLYKALDLFQQLDDKAAAADVLNMLGNLATSQSDITTAIDYYEQSLKLWQELDFPDPLKVENITHNLCLSYYSLNEIAKAKSLWMEIEERLTRTGEKTSLLALVKLGLGLVASKEKDWKQATTYFEESLEIINLSGDKRSLIYYFMCRAEFEEMQQEFLLAQESYEQSLKLNLKLGSRDMTAQCLYRLGRLALRADSLNKAKSYISRGMNTFIELDRKPEIYVCLLNLAELVVKHADVINDVNKDQSRQLYKRTAKVLGAISAMELLPLSLQQCPTLEIREARKLNQQLVEKLESYLDKELYEESFNAGKDMNSIPQILNLIP